MSASRLLPVTTRPAAAGAALLLLAGCSALTPGPETPESELMATPLASTSGYVVDGVTVRHAVRLPQGALALDPAEAATLDAFLARERIKPGDVVSVAAGGAQPFTRGRAVADHLGARGLSVASITTSPDTGDDVLLTVEHAVYTPTACLQPGIAAGGDILGGYRSSDRTVMPLGCATALNLARMIVDPSELASGRALGPPEAARSVLAVQQYRLGESDELTTASE